MISFNGLTHSIKSPLASLHAYLSIQKYKQTSGDTLDFDKIDTYIFSISNRIEFIAACCTFLQSDVPSDSSKPLLDVLASYSILSPPVHNQYFALPESLLPINSGLVKLISITNYSIESEKLAIFTFTNPAPLISIKDFSYLIDLYISCCAHCGVKCAVAENSFELLNLSQ